jgi:hypothetical protein
LLALFTGAEIDGECAVLMLRGNRKYAFYMEGYDTKDEVYGKTLLDTGSTEWFYIVKE